jgi:predicted HAD superfamily Cof-like phosphohydrolase
MNETDNIPADWAIEAALKAPNGVDTTSSNIWTVNEIKEAHKHLRYAASVMAHATLIAKHEQPPVDPDVEAVKRILLKCYGSYVILGENAVARAVAQYKQERGQ